MECELRATPPKPDRPAEFFRLLPLRQPVRTPGLVVRNRSADGYQL